MSRLLALHMHAESSTATTTRKLPGEDLDRLGDSPDGLLPRGELRWAAHRRERGHGRDAPDDSDRFTRPPRRRVRGVDKPPVEAGATPVAKSGLQDRRHATRGPCE